MPNYQLGDRNVGDETRRMCPIILMHSLCLARLVQRRREFTAGRERLLCGTHFYRLTDWSWPSAASYRRYLSQQSRIARDSRKQFVSGVP
jgi:hypothetical protein